MRLRRNRAFHSALLFWFRRHGRDLPWRRTRDPYAILVSEVMLQQTQVATVVPYYQKWLRRFPNFASLARASEDDVLRAWQGLGYYARARNLHATARAVLQGYGGHFPRSVERMQQLPGIGRYTAHAMASFAFNQSLPIVEANTTRALARLFDLRKPVDSSFGRNAIWQHAAHLVPKSGARTFNSALIDLGAVICITPRPKCDLCPVKTFCRAKNPVTLPVRRLRQKTERLTEAHALIVRRGRILLQQSQQRWRGMWILPPLELDGLTQSSFEMLPIYQATFSFTHHRITLFVYRRHPPKQIAPEQQWFASLDDVAMPSPHRRAAEALTKYNGNLLMQQEQHDDTGSSR